MGFWRHWLKCPFVPRTRRIINSAKCRPQTGGQDTTVIALRPWTFAFDLRLGDPIPQNPMALWQSRAIKLGSSANALKSALSQSSPFLVSLSVRVYYYN